MFTVLLFGVVGVYVLLVAAGLLHRSVVGELDHRRRAGLLVCGLGFLALTAVHAYRLGYFTPEPGILRAVRISIEHGFHDREP